MYSKLNTQPRQWTTAGNLNNYNCRTAIGMRVKDGVVLAVEKILHSKLLKHGANPRIQTGDMHIGVAFSGLLADGRHLVNKVRENASNYRDTYKMPIPGKRIAEQLALHVQYYTLYSHLRPFGASALLAVMDKTQGPQLYMVEPSGVFWGYYGCAIGKGKQIAKTEIEKLDLKNLTAREAVKEAAKIIYKAHDESKDREFELEISWVCAENGMKHQLVPKDLLEEAEKLAKEAEDAMNE